MTGMNSHTRNLDLRSWREIVGTLDTNAEVPPPDGLPVVQDGAIAGAATVGAGVAVATLSPASVTTVSAGGIMGFLGATTAVFVWPLPRLGSLLWSAWQPHSVVRKFFHTREGCAAVQCADARLDRRLCHELEQPKLSGEPSSGRDAASCERRGESSGPG